MQDALKTATSAKYSALYFFGVVAVLYGAIPAMLGATSNDPYMWKLAGLGAIGCIAGLTGFYLPILDRQFKDGAWRLHVDTRIFHGVIWASFGVFVAVAFATAESIPLISALTGSAGLVDLDQERAAFLKMREGWEVSLGYFSGAFTGALLPYSMSALFISKSKFRFASLAVFFLYTQSFLQKALFLQMVIPLAYLVIQRKIWNYFGLAALLLATAFVLYTNSILARGVDQFSSTGAAVASYSEMLSESYRPKSTAEHLIWRASVVPILTARDALIVHDKEYNGALLLGSTSTLVAKLFGLERVNYDAAVHFYQFGEKEIGRANSVYLTEGFVNFGWIGVALFSLIVGQCFRCFWKSHDDAFKAMWPIFSYNLLLASLIGSMFSGGLLLLFLIALFISPTTTAVAQSTLREIRPSARS